LLPEVNAYFRAIKRLKQPNEWIARSMPNQFSVPEYLFVARLFNRTSPDAADAPTSPMGWQSAGYEATRERAGRLVF
jgi:hypothetical protein